MFYFLLQLENTNAKWVTSMSLLPPRWASSTAHVWQKWSSVWPVKEYLTGMLCPSLTPALSSRCSPTGSGLRCVHVRVLYSLESSTNKMMFFIEEHLIFTYTKTQSWVLLSYMCLKTIFNSLHWLFSYIISKKCVRQSHTPFPHFETVMHVVNISEKFWCYCKSHILQ